MKNNHITLESMSQAVWYNRWTMKKFSKYISGDILEIGFGNGNFTNTLMDYGPTWAIDIDQHFVKSIRKNSINGLAIGRGDIEKGIYFFKKRNFDTIVCLNVLEHINNDRHAIVNMFSLLKSGGYLILLVPAHKWLFGSIDKAIGHYRRYEISDLLALLHTPESSLVYHRRINFLGALGWYIAGKIAGSSTVSLHHLKYFNLIAPYILPIEDIIEPIIGTSYLVILRKK